jgi:anti-anti-sigma factor
VNINYINKGKYTILEIEGRLDTTNYGELEKALQERLDASEINLILDCEKLNYVSSSGLRIFLMFFKKTKAAGGKLLLCSLQDEIVKIFRICGFDGIFDIYGDCKAAERDIEKSG